MRALTADYRDAIEHMPDGATLVIHHVDWETYEHLVDGLVDRRGVRLSYDSGRLQIRTPLAEHEAFARLIDALVRFCAEATDRQVESYGAATWKSRRLAKGVEPDACYYVTNAERIVGKHPIELDSDPLPDLVVEIDITHESLGKFSIYAALGVSEIWRYDGERVWFYRLAGEDYREVPRSLSFPELTPASIAEALEQSKSKGQTAAFRDLPARWRDPRRD